MDNLLESDDNVALALLNPLVWNLIGNAGTSNAEAAAVNPDEDGEFVLAGLGWRIHIQVQTLEMGR